MRGIVGREGETKDRLSAGFYHRKGLRKRQVADYSALVLRSIGLRFALERQNLNGSDKKRHQNEFEFHSRLRTHHSVSRPLALLAVTFGH